MATYPLRLHLGAGTVDGFFSLVLLEDWTRWSDSGKSSSATSAGASLLSTSSPPSERGGVGRSCLLGGLTLAAAADIACDEELAGPSSACTLISEKGTAGRSSGFPALGRLFPESVSFAGFSADCFGSAGGVAAEIEIRSLS